jgi:hypothetical protein
MVPDFPSQFSTIHDRAVIGSHNTCSQRGAEQRRADNAATLGGPIHRNAVTTADDLHAICRNRDT